MANRTSKQQTDLPAKLSQPAQRALAAAGVRRLQDLTKFSEDEVRRWHGIGPNAMKQLREALAAQGLSFAETSTGKKESKSMSKSESKDSAPASQQIDNYIDELGDWHRKMLARLRRIILQAAPELAEEWKWDTPVWSHKGNVVAAGVFKDHVKLNFFKGASLQDPNHLFNAGLDAKASRGIDLKEGDEIDEAALKDLVRAAVVHNTSGKK